jgi:hypothetical protein
VVEQLRPPVEGANGGEAAADQAQIERRDTGARRGSGEDRSSTRKGGGEDHGPAHGESDVGEGASHEVGAMTRSS